MEIFDKGSTRKQFLKNISLASLAAGLFPLSGLSRAKAPNSAPPVACDRTTLDYYGQGPFYTVGAPTLSGTNLAPSGEPGTPILISGRIRNLDCLEVIPNTVLDIWHADAAGAYDNSGFHLRGKITSNSQGFYLFESVMPGKYLNGNQYRPSHIHFKITPPGYPTLTTQLYFAGDSQIPVDAAASISSGTYDATHRIIPMTMNGNGQMEGTWDIVLDGSGITGLNEPHLELGMIYGLAPNPFTDQLEINYGVFKQSEITLSVFDLNGKLVAELPQQSLSPQKYTAVWQPEASLPTGHYFIALKVNDLQVHYLKTMRVKG